MKKNLNYFLLMGWFLGSCAANEVLEEDLYAETDAMTKFTVVMPQFQYNEMDSRTDITMGEYPNISSQWTNGDSIGIFPSVGDQLSFRIETSGDGKTCAFDGGGWALKASAYYTAYSPFKRSYYYQDKDELLISMLGQKQIGNSSTKHLGAYDVKIATGTKPSNGGLTFNMERKVALVRMDLTAPTAATWKTITVHLPDQPVFATEAVMDFTSETPVITPTSYSSTLTLELENVVTTETDKDITAYMMMLPVNLTGCYPNVLLTDSEGMVYRGDFDVTNAKNDFTANGARWVKETYFSKWGKSFYVEKAGTLSTVISDADKYSMTSLKIIGELNGDDIALLRRMMGYRESTSDQIGTLKNLDLSEASIVEGGGCYYENYYTSNNVIGEEMFANCYYLEDINLPDNVTTIGDCAFYGCKKISTIRIPNNVKSVGAGVFMGCSNLWICILPDDITTIKKGMFSGCYNFSGLTYSKKTTTIEDNAFYACRFNSFTLQENVTYIGNNAFSSGTSDSMNYLDFFLCLSTTPPTLGTDVFNTQNTNDVLYVPKGCVDVYKNSAWGNYFDEIRENN